MTQDPASGWLRLQREPQQPLDPRVPERIVVPFTDRWSCGRFRGGQWLAHSCSLVPFQADYPSGAALHLFDNNGAHTQTLAKVLTEYSEYVEVAPGHLLEPELWELVRRLRDVEACDIVVEPFMVRIEGRPFGLCDDSNPNMGRVVMWPNNYLFYAPWDGRFDT